MKISMPLYRQFSFQYKGWYVNCMDFNPNAWGKVQYQIAYGEEFMKLLIENRLIDKNFQWIVKKGETSVYWFDKINKAKNEIINYIDIHLSDVVSYYKSKHNL